MKLGTCVQAFGYYSCVPYRVCSQCHVHTVISFLALSVGPCGWHSLSSEIRNSVLYIPTVYGAVHRPCEVLGGICLRDPSCRKEVPSLSRPRNSKVLLIAMCILTHIHLSFALVHSCFLHWPRSWPWSSPWSWSRSLVFFPGFARVAHFVQANALTPALWCT